MCQFVTHGVVVINIHVYQNLVMSQKCSVPYEVLSYKELSSRSVSCTVPRVQYSTEYTTHSVKYRLYAALSSVHSMQHTRLSTDYMTHSVQYKVYTLPTLHQHGLFLSNVATGDPIAHESSVSH